MVLSVRTKSRRQIMGEISHSHSWSRETSGVTCRVLMDKQAYHGRHAYAASLQASSPHLVMV